MNASHRDGELKQKIAEATREAVSTANKKEKIRKIQMEWCLKLQDAQVRKTQRKFKNEADDTIAEYCPFGVIVQKEGGDQAAYAAARHWVLSGALMQKRGYKWRDLDWFKYNTMTKRLEILYIKTTYRQGFERSWEDNIVPCPCVFC